MKRQSQQRKSQWLNIYEKRLHLTSNQKNGREISYPTQWKN